VDSMSLLPGQLAKLRADIARQVDYSGGPRCASSSPRRTRCGRSVG